MLENWKKITNKDIEIIKNENLKLKNIEYFNSIIYQMYNKMVYKIIDNNLIICKPISIMGKFNIIQYCNLNISENLNKQLLDTGITLRGHHIQGTKDKFGDEFIYDTVECVKLIGPKFNKFRKALSKYKDFIKIENGFHDDIYQILKLYTKPHTKLFKFILKNASLVTVTRVYINDTILGFSIVENINTLNGIIIQELFNKNIGVRYASYIIHYCNCVKNTPKLLNAGGSSNKNIGSSTIYLNYL